MDHRRPKRLAPIWENVLFAFQAMRERLFRSFLTVMGVFIGVVIIIGVASVLNGFLQKVVGAIEQWGTSNIYISRLPMMQMSRLDTDIRKRNAGSGLWIVLTLFAGLFGAIVYALVRLGDMKEEAEEEPAASSGRGGRKSS